MRLLKCLTCAVALGTFAGCIEIELKLDGLFPPACENPLHTAEVLVSEPSLEGLWEVAWTNEKGFGQTYHHERSPAYATVSFTKTGTGRYDFAYVASGSRITGVAHLVKLSQQHRHHYLDLEIRDVEGDMAKWASLRGFPPLRVIKCVGIGEDVLGDAPIDISWINDVAESDGFAIRTASTDQLQELFYRHGEELGSSLYSQTVYRRKPSPR